MTEIIENNKATLVRGGTKLIAEGGVITYIRNNIPYHRLSILECDGVELL